MVPKPPTGSAEPKRHAFTHSQPRSSRGSPQMGQLPVEHGADAVGPDDEVAVSEVAVHDGLGRACRPVVSASQRKASSKAGWGCPSRSTRTAAARRRHHRGVPGPRRRDPVDGGEDPAALAGQGRAPARRRRAVCRRGIVSPSTKSMTRIAGRAATPVPRRDHVGDGHAGRGRRPEQSAASSLRPDSGAPVGRVAAPDGVDAVEAARRRSATSRGGAAG